MSSLLTRFRWRTPTYQNTGSTARDHLASERTFLAWMRTGLGFVALGIAVERFSQLDLEGFLQPLLAAGDAALVGVAPAAGDGSSSSSSSSPSSSSLALELRRRLEDAQRKKAADEEERRRDRLHSQVLVGCLMALGSGSIVYGTARYFSNLRLLEVGRFKPAYHGAAVLAAAVAGLAGGVFGNAVRRERRRESV